MDIILLPVPTVFTARLLINPYFVLQNFSNLDDVNRVTGDVNLSYKPFNWLNIVERIGVDSYSDRRKLISPKYLFEPDDESGTGQWGPETNNGSYEVDQINVTRLYMI